METVRRRNTRWWGPILALSLLVPSLANATVTPGHKVIVSDDPADWTPHVRDGRVNALAIVGNKVIVGGSFTEVRRANTSAFLRRNYIFAFDRTTGTIDTSFVPQLDGEVTSLEPAPGGQAVFAGGYFQTVNGTTRRRVARLNVANGQLVTFFNANANARVLDLAVSGNRLFMAGAFKTIRGASAQGLAAVDVTTGALDSGVNFTFTDPWRGAGRVSKIDITPDGSRLVAIGNFQRVSGLDRKQIVMFDLTRSPVRIADWHTNQFPQLTSSGASWCSPSFHTYMRDVAFSPNGSFFVIGTAGAFRGGRLCDTASRWETFTTGTDLMPTWVDWTGGDTLTAVAVTETAVYVGGHQRWMNNPYAGDRHGPGGVPRSGIAALDPVNGLPFRWDPGRNPRGVGVFAFLPAEEGLWLGSDTNNIGGEFHGRLALMPVAGGTPVPRVETFGLPSDLYNLESSGGAMVRRLYDGTSFGTRQSLPTGVDWRLARGAFIINDKLYHGWSDGRLYSRSFDGLTVGPAEAVALHGLEVQPPSSFLIPGTNTRVPAFTTEVASATGMFYDRGRLYYTVADNPRLYYRYFTPESQVVGANLFVTSTASSVNWGSVSGMVLIDGQLYFGSTNGTLSRIDFSNGQVSGSPTIVGGPGVDGYNWSSRGMLAFGQAAPDTEPPTRPGKPSGVATSPNSIELTWAASKDDRSTQLTYRIYRDGASTPIGTITSSSTTTVAFTDAGVASGSTHTYVVDARDEAGNTSAPSPASDPITAPATATPVFADAFESGNFSKWTAVTRLSIDSSTGGAAPPSARGAPSNQSAFARKNLDASYPQVCLSQSVRLSQAGDPVVLMRLRSASGDPIVRVFVNASGVLIIRSDAGSAQRSSGTALPPGWNTVRICGSVGTAGTWFLYLNGAPIVNGWVANTGTSPVGRIEIGDNGTKTWSGNFDDVVLLNSIQG